MGCTSSSIKNLAESNAAPRTGLNDDHASMNLRNNDARKAAVSQRDMENIKDRRECGFIYCISMHVCASYPKVWQPPSVFINTPNQDRPEKRNESDHSDDKSIDTREPSLAVEGKSVFSFL